MRIVIEFYIIICVLLLIFDIGFLVTKNSRVQEYYPKSAAFAEDVRKALMQRREMGDFPPGFMPWLSRKLKKTKYLITLIYVLDNRPQERNEFRWVVQGLLDAYAEKSHYEQAYYTYVISTFDYENKPVSGAFGGKFLTFLDSKSLYTFSNTMMALYAFGDTTLLLQALDKVDERSGFYHKKLLVDGLLSAKVDRAEFNARLLERFDQYTAHTQDCLLDYLRMSGSDIADLSLRLMQTDTIDSQVRYSAMRYFIRYPNEKAKALFMKILEQKEAPWLEQMLAIQALERYPEDIAVWALVREKVTSPDWFVRVNAVEYLHKSHLSREELASLLALRDRYANESLLYQYRDDADMTAFILETIRTMEEEKEVAHA